MDKLTGRLTEEVGIRDAVAGKNIHFIRCLLANEEDVRNIADELLGFGCDTFEAGRVGDIIAGTPVLPQFA